jgi:hypothetical protein
VVVKKRHAQQVRAKRINSTGIPKSSGTVGIAAIAATNVTMNRECLA